jgi:hypothetical protein
MPNRLISFASAVSFGDFVIAHSALNRIEDQAKARARLIACSHLIDLNGILPIGVRVTLVESGEDRVPAVFDVRKCGALAAVQSAFSLRSRFQKIEREKNEVLAFHALGVRERFIAGRWPVIAPRTRRRNIYETYYQFLADQGIRTLVAPPLHAGTARTVGIFPESRLVEKRLSAPTLSIIFAQAERAGLEAKLFVLDGDRARYQEHSAVVNISRNFASLADAIRSVDSVISADSLPAHLGEYFARPVFVALSRPNEYWLPHGCFTQKRWGIFNQAGFSASLDSFLGESRAA